MSAQKLPYRAIWWREVSAGMNGQDPERPSTWKFDALWRAASLQYRAEETARFLRESIDRGAHRDAVQHLLKQYESDVAACHRAVLGGNNAAA